MATISDDFTGGYDTGLWSVLDSQGAGTVGEANNQIECINDGGGTTEIGLVTQSTYDLTAPSDAQADFVKVENEGWVYLGLTKVTGSNPWSEADWYRFGQASGSYYAQKKVGGSSSTIGSGSAASPTVTYKIDLPSSGDDVRFIEGAAEKTSEATYSLSSRDCYIYVFGALGTAVATNEFDFDTFSATYTGAAGGATIPVLAYQHYHNRGSSL